MRRSQIPWPTTPIGRRRPGIYGCGLIEPVYYAASLRIEIPIELAAKYVYAVDAASNSTVPVPSIVASPCNRCGRGESTMDSPIRSIDLVTGLAM